jgi:EmrB/QacA subfamily drug resistance transporter
MKDHYEKSEKNAVLLVASLASFLTPFMSSSVNVALPSIAADFNADAILVSWIATSYLLAAAVFLIPAGRLSDIFGRKRIFLTGIIVFTIASLFCGLSWSAGILIVFRVAQAFGSAMIFGAGMAILTSVFPPNERGRAMGITVAAVYTGLTLGPFAGGILTEQFGWKSIFYFVVPLGLIVIYFVMKKLQHEWADAKAEKFDWKGSLMYAVSLVLIMYGFPKLPAFQGLIFLLSGLVVFVVFISWELRIAHPVIDLSLFKRNLTFRYSNLAALINYSATFATGFMLSFYFQEIRSLSAQQTGFILVSSPVVMALLSPLAGKLSDRFEPRFLSSLGMLISAAGLMLLFFISSSTGIFQLVLILSFMGIGFALFASPNANAIMGSVERKHLGLASGSMGTMRLVGQMTSMGISMMLFAFFIGNEAIHPGNLQQLLQAIKAAFLLFTFLCLLGVFISLRRGKLHGHGG